jgi:predicted nucleotidyltransferase
MTYKSDIDLMVRFDPDQRTTMFDYAEITHALEQRTRKKIDLGEEGTLSPFALKTAKKDIIKIYG